MAASLIAQGVPAGDTVVVRMSGSPLADAAAVAIIVIALFMVVLLAAGIPAFLAVRRLSETLARAAHDLSERAEPVLERLRTISESVDYIARSLRSDVRRLNATVARFTDRLSSAADRMEERVEDLNALLDVMQGEAEDLLLDTASTVRGVREGVRALGRRAPAARDGAPGEMGERGPQRALEAGPASGTRHAPEPEERPGDE